MKEAEILTIIKNTLTDSSYIGDDCAFLKDFGLYVTQDSLVEGVHFNLSYMTPFQLGIKAVTVNVSDLLTAVSMPMYITVGLSLPNTVDEKFVKELYRGIDTACLKYGVKVIGGDITGSEKVVISITAIGKRCFAHGVSRKFAKESDFIIATGHFGTASAGLYALENKLPVSNILTDAFLTPEARLPELWKIKYHLDYDIASTDSSDSLAESLFQIAEASGVSISVNYSDIPVLPEVREFAKTNNLDEKDFVLWGGEDFELIFCVQYWAFSTMDTNMFKYIGQVGERTDKPTVTVYDNKSSIVIDREMTDRKSFDHFGG